MSALERIPRRRDARTADADYVCQRERTPRSHTALSAGRPAPHGRQTTARLPGSRQHRGSSPPQSGSPTSLMLEHTARKHPNEGSMTRVNSRKLRQGQAAETLVPAAPRKNRLLSAYEIVYCLLTTREGRRALPPRQAIPENGSDGNQTDAQQSKANFHRDSPFAVDYWNSPGPGATSEYITRR